MSRRAALVDGALLQVVWFAAVLGGARGTSLPGVVAAAALVLLAARRSDRPGRTLLLAATLGAVGALHESLQRAFAVTTFPGHEGPLAPAWILALWPALAVTLPTAFGWLAGRPRLAALTGAFGGPLGYVAAERLGAVALPAGPLGAAAPLALGWGVLFPAGVVLTGRLLPSCRRDALDDRAATPLHGP